MEISPGSNSKDENRESRNEDLATAFPQTVNDFEIQPLDGKVAAFAIPQTSSGTILIVDDTPDNLLMLFSYLKEQGFKVLLVEDGATALKIARSQAPDIILLDVLMPQIDGFETCRRLKSNTITKDIPIIFLTTLAETVDKARGFRLGVVDYITKPTEPEEVLVRIQTHLKLRNMHRALEKQSQTIAKQNRKLQQAYNFDRVVRCITEKIRDSFYEKQILEIATKELAQALDLSSCQIELYDFEQTTVTIAYEYTITLPPYRGVSRNIDEFPELYQQLLQKNSLQLVESIPQSSPQGIQVTRLACPIFDDRGVMGNLWGLRPPNEVFTTLEIQFVQQIAAQCAIAIRQAKLYQTSTQQVEELAKLNQLKNDFLKTITHELKSPASSIQLATETIETLLADQQNLCKSKRFQRVLQIFRKSCRRQNELIDDLLTICHIEAKAKIAKPESIDLHPWIENLTKLHLQCTKNQQQRLILDLAPEELHITIDPTILERIVRELLQNAYKYTPAGQTITIQTKVTESEIFLCTINTGVEIPLKEQKLIFDLFYRIPNNDPWQYGGTGLGLTLVKKLTKMLEATVDVESENLKTTFCIRLPKNLQEIA